MATYSNFVYISAFGLTALACFASLFRAQQIEDRETRLGLLGLLAGSGAWASANVAVLVLPGFALKNAAYLVGLVFGFATVWAWLYFCSAYTGRWYHRARSFRLAGLAVYLLIVLVKITNPLHQAYYTASMTTGGFSHLVIQHGVIHWTVTGLSYALASMGLFMLFEQFTESDYDTRVVGALAGLTAIPVLLDIAAYTLPQLVNIIHAPFGVAAFAIGTLFLYQDRFLAVYFTTDIDGAIVFLDSDDRIRDFNDAARRIIPELAGAHGQSVTSIEPLSDAYKSDRGVLDFRIDGSVRHYLVTENDFAMGQVSHGRILVLTDVTRIERQRRELERHNEQLEELAVGIRHELRNTLQIVSGNVDAAAQYVESEPETARRALSTAGTTADRMRDIVDELSMFAEYSQSVEQTSPLPFRGTVEAAWRRADVTNPELRIRGEGTIEANETRFEELLDRAFAFADAVDGSTVTIELGENELVIETDGQQPAATSAETFFEFEESVPTAEAGMALPSLRTLARAHGWEPTFDPDYDAGVRIVVEGVVTRLSNATTPE